MRYGPIVAKRYKKQYFKYGKWLTMHEWDRQPEAQYKIMRELKSKEAIDLFIGPSWTKRLPRKKSP